MQKKQCSICKFYKPFSEFNRHSGFPNNLDCWCKSCARKKAKERYNKNREKILQQGKDSRERRKDAIKKQKKEYYEAHKDDIITKATQWNRAHPKRVYEKTKKYRNDNPEKTKAHNAINNAVRRGILLPAHNFKCAICKEKQALDYHHYLGYSSQHHLDVQPLCRKCHKKVG